MRRIAFEDWSSARPILSAVLLTGISLQLSCFTSGVDSGLVRHAGEAPVADRFVVAGMALESPVVITLTATQTDGGTLELGFTDARGTHLFAFLDGSQALRAKAGEVLGPRSVSIVEPVSSPSPTPLEIGGADERELHRMLEACIARASTDGSQLVRHDLGIYPNHKPDPDRDRQRVMAFKAALERAVKGAR